MTYQQTIEILSQITYKPGYIIDIRRVPESDKIEVRISVIRPDVKDTSRNIVIASIYSIYLLNDNNEEGLIYQFRESVKQFEIHEMDEWLKYKGKPLRDPHPVVF